MAKLAVYKYFSFIILVITIVMMIFTFVGLWGGSENPAGNTAKAMLCFALPLLLIGDFILLIYWMIRRRWHWAVLPAIAILCCWSYIGTLFQLRSQPSDAEAQDGVKIATYNVGRFGKEASGFIAQDILMEMERQNVDILCIQEYSDLAGDSKNQTKFLKYFKYMAMGKGDMVIYSKFPIIDSKNILFEESNNSALWADIKNIFFMILFLFLLNYVLIYDISQLTSTFYGRMNTILLNHTICGLINRMEIN